MSTTKKSRPSPRRKQRAARPTEPSQADRMLEHVRRLDAANSELVVAVRDLMAGQVDPTPVARVARASRTIQAVSAFLVAESQDGAS